ncbi:hypothetical protein SLEP1_g38718 [Rubroshorea leprosula]|uniref:Uncharacterized protein n=1 Tax=Rubroshorea leprosula TaxID=152421 RepID=A0AAV5KY37_9ROSI|nr:hypothetical protein SLEP1_g38718 [Rubroshorea leprosula]
MALSNPDQEIVGNGAEDQEDQENVSSAVTSHLYIKPTHPEKTLDKEVVLRKIRQRKRVNNVKKVLQSFVGAPAAKTGNKQVSVQGKKWIDDAFAAP